MRLTSPLIAAAMVLSLVAASAGPAQIDLTGDDGTPPYAFDVAIDCGPARHETVFRIFEEAPRRPGAEILAEVSGRTAQAADPDDLGQVMESVLLAGTDCDLPENLATLSSKVAFGAETVRVVGALHPGLRLADLYFGRAIDDPMPLEYGSACLTASVSREAPGIDALRATITRARTARDAVVAAEPGQVEGQFMIAFNLAVFELSRALATCAFAEATGATDHAAQIAAEVSGLERFAAMVADEVRLDTATRTSGDWRFRQRGWGASALGRAGFDDAGPWFGYVCTLAADATFGWSFIVAAADWPDRATLLIDGTRYSATLAGREERRLAGLDAGFRYLNFGADSESVFEAVRAAREMWLMSPRASQRDIPIPTRGSARALKAAQDHCAARADAIAG